ncbi:MAG: phage baseplate assembly protein V [Saprospiraceae bacterium]|nr:hypothetical protein [Lewinella sp.]
MATAAATIFVGGDRLLPYRVHLEQRSDWHHRFEVTISTEKAKVMGVDMKASESNIIDNAIAYAGEAIEITVDRSVGSLTFKGYVTDVQVDETYAGDAFVILKGFSPTYLLDGQRSVACFEEQGLKDISGNILQDFPSNIKQAVNPKYTDVIPYVVRYKETQYQFLSRLAATYGEWFYYDGQQLVFGDLPAKSPMVKLTFGSDSMLSFNYGLNVRPTSFKQHFYKYEDNAPVEHSVSSFKPGWLDAHSKQSLKASEELFKEEGLNPVDHHIADSNHIKYIAEAKKSGILSDVMIFRGQSADPRIAVGAEVEVSSRKGFIGKYRVTSVVHSFDSNRDYYNIFQAIPATSLTPPVNRGVVMPEAEPQVAEVTDNNDPDKLGRVRVKFKWEGGTTPWIRVLTNYAGPGASEGVTGSYFIPEIGDEVFVEFEHNNPARPYVVGSLYHGSTAPDFADPSDNLKAIKTRSGHKLVFDDTDGKESILITDKKGNLLTIQTFEDSITVNAGDHITINAGKSISIEAGQTIAMRSGNSITLASGSISLIAGSTVSVNAGSAYNLITTNKMENVSANTLLKTKNLTNYVSDNFSSTAKVINQTAKKDINSKAKKNILISAESKLDQRGGSVDVNAKKGKVKVKAKGNTELKGKQVKSN